jgi:HlyD family secretion protein
MASIANGEPEEKEAVTEPTPIRKPDAAPSMSGGGMDRRVSRRKTRIAIGVTAGIAVVALAAFVWMVKPAPAGTYVLKASRVQIAEARRGMLDESVSSLGAVAPAQTVLLDAVEGGRVERVLAANGDVVAAGQILLELTNTQLQLEVLARETEVAAQMNQLREQELALERNRLNDSQTLARGQAEVERLERLVTRSERLAEQGAIAPAQLEDYQAQLVLQRRLQDISKNAETAGERMSRSQMEQMRIATQRLERNLEAARNSLSQLTVRAPVAGVLTSFTPEVGQTLSRNARIGQIDAAEDVKLTVSLDEYYLNRITPGLAAEATINGTACRLKIGRVSSQVENGTFKADILFEGPCAGGQLRRGQSVPVKIVLSEPQPALLVPNGAFMISTGGAWVFVVSTDGKSAERRDIKLGRRSIGAVEVLEGLRPGERIVTSDYEGFADARALQIQQ